MVEIKMLNKKALSGTVLLVILLLVAGFFAYQKFHGASRVVSKQLVGSVDSIDNNILTVSGSFTSTDHPEISKDAKTVKVSVDSQTKITKVIVHLPPEEQLIKSKGYFDARKLKRDESTSNIDTLKTDLKNSRYGVTFYIYALNNVYGKSSFTASEIKYETAQ